MRRITSTVVHNGISVAALSAPKLMEDFRNTSVLVLAVGATGTIKVKASNVPDDQAINFATPSTVTNPWYYVDLKGLGDGATTVVGSTGIALSVSTFQKGYAINIDMAKWICVDVETLSAGTVSVILSGATND